MGSEMGADSPRICLFWSASALGSSLKGYQRSWNISVLGIRDVPMVSFDLQVYGHFDESTKRGSLRTGKAISHTDQQ